MNKNSAERALVRSAVSLPTAESILRFHREVLGREYSLQGLVGEELLTDVRTAEFQESPQWLKETTAYLVRVHLNADGEELISLVRSATDTGRVKRAFESIPPRFRSLLFSEEMRRQVFFTRREKEEIEKKCPPPFLFFERYRGHFRAIIPLEVRSVLNGEKPSVHESLPALSFLLREETAPEEGDFLPLSLLDVFISRMISLPLKVSLKNDGIVRSEFTHLRNLTGEDRGTVKIAESFCISHLTDRTDDVFFLPQDAYILVLQRKRWLRSLLIYLARRFEEQASLIFLLPWNRCFSVSLISALSGREKEWKEVFSLLKVAGLLKTWKNLGVMEKEGEEDSKAYAQATGEIHLTGRNLAFPVMKLSPFAVLREMSSHHVLMKFEREAVYANRFRFRSEKDALTAVEDVTGISGVSRRIQDLIKHHWSSSSTGVMERKGWILSFAEEKQRRRAEVLLKAKGIGFLRENSYSLIIRSEDVEKAEALLREGGMALHIKKTSPSTTFLARASALARFLRQIVREENLDRFLRDVEEEALEFLGEDGSGVAEKEFAFLIQYFGMISRSLQRRKKSKNSEAVLKRVREAEKVELYVREPVPEGYRFSLVEGEVVEVTSEGVELWRRDRNFSAFIPAEWILEVRER